MFREGDKIEPYIQRFKDMAKLCKSDEPTKQLHFRALFEGKPIDILHHLDPSKITFDAMKTALLQACGKTPDELKLQFFQFQLEGHETPEQFTARHTSYFDQWVEQDGTPHTYCTMDFVTSSEEITFHSLNRVT